MPSDGAAPDGNREVYRERAETYLRLLAEAALRLPSRDIPDSDACDQLRRAADLLVEADILTGAQATWIFLDFVTALRARGHRAPAGIQPGQVRRAISPRNAGAAPGDWRVFPGPAPVRGGRLMALIVTPDRALAPATLSFPPSAGLTDLQNIPWADLSAADGAGTDYRTTFATGSWAGSTWTGTILLRPAPPAGAGWIKISIPNGLSLLSPLPDPPPAQAGDLEALTDSPGERLLTRHAEALLATLTSSAGTLAGVESALPELTGTLEAAGALSAFSVVPRQVAALYELRGLLPAGLGSCDELPARWMHVAGYYGRRRRPAPASGTASVGAALPVLDGARFAVAGLHSGPAGTDLHVVAHGLRPLPQRVQPGVDGDAGFSWWVRDDTGDWHLCVICEATPAATETMLRMAVLPPLTHRTSTLTAEVTGPTTRVTVTLGVHW